MTSEKNFSVNTMNARLNEAGLLEDFYGAANKKDRDGMVALLMSVEIEKSQAEETSDAILNNPAFNPF